MKMTTMIKQIGLVVGIVAIHVMHATADECADILKAGIYDELNLATSTSVESRLDEYLSKSVDQLQTLSKEKSGGGKLSLSILDYVGLKAQGSGESKSSELSKLKTQYESNKKAFFSSSDFLNLAQKTVNESVIKAWQECMQGRYVVSYITGDPLSEATVVIRYAKQPPEGKPEIPLTDISVVNLELVGNPAPKLQPGIKLAYENTILQNFKRIDPSKSASLIASWGAFGVVSHNFAPKPAPAPISSPTPENIPVSKQVKAIGGKRLAGGDNEMDTDPQDTVTVTFSSTLSWNEQRVLLKMAYTCEEYKGNHTKLGQDTDEVIYTVPSDKRIVDVAFKGNAAFVQNPTPKGKNHGFLKMPGIAGTYWKELTYRVDSADKNDAPAIGTDGVVEFTVKLLPK